MVANVIDALLTTMTSSIVWAAGSAGKLLPSTSTITIY